jgi:non-ribosomal peptide synthetase component F
VETAAIHRRIEQHAATHPSAVALVDGSRTLTYRELNYRANACARHLLAAGFKRGAHARVSLPPGAELAITLLAVLKVGGSYAWTASSADSTDQVITVQHREPYAGELRLDLAPILRAAVQPSANLPVLSRGSDIACVLERSDGIAEVLIPHASIVSLQRQIVAMESELRGEPGALDLWMVLLAGATAVTGALHAVAAA